MSVTWKSQDALTNGAESTCHPSRWGSTEVPSWYLVVEGVYMFDGRYYHWNRRGGDDMSA